ncbi:conserved hypothetical protein [Theileria orientalis strain Shintoku]|uniref:WDHD1/CFT4 second beta-propeller domain-containing protein n=1 Tax=Theileria orientalis strain Shintoku TaxID=869250 RepID=J4CDR2_THEOR|nr:conserved hypothetical protein [Theileria orientalis strain Shintoku]BAM41587.1 conserved hypothetical protein [Theileria orientalis strain Shintoku]|eukprot:XP_009691888.1 conserved hypothetical protein [Theileria orientalis strain Shintoku]
MEKLLSVYGICDRFVFNYLHIHFRFVVFCDEKKLTLYKDFSNETVNSTTLDLVDSLNDDGYKELAADVKSSGYITSLSVNKLSNPNNVFNDDLKNKLRGLDEFQYLLSMSLDNALVLLCLYNYSDGSLKVLNHNKVLGDNKEDSRLFGSISQVETVFREDVYTFFKSNDDLHLLDWKSLKSVKLLSNVSTYKFFKEQLIVFFNTGLKVYEFDHKKFDSTYDNKENVLVLKHELPCESELNGSMSQKNVVNRNLVTVLEEKRLLFLAGLDGIFYTFLDKFSLYKFVSSPGDTGTSSDSVNGTGSGSGSGYYSYLDSLSVGDMNVLLLMNKNHVQIWDYDTQVVLYQMKNSGFDLCFLNVIDSGVVNLLTFQSAKLVDSIKLYVNDDKFVPVDAPKETSDVQSKRESKEASPMDKKDALKDDEVNHKRKSDDEKYKKLKRIKRSKYLDNEANEINRDEEELDLNGDVDDEAEGEDEEERDYNEIGDDYTGIDYRDNDDQDLRNDFLKSELVRLHKKVKVLEERLVSRGAKVTTPGTCPRPNDQLKQCNNSDMILYLMVVPLNKRSVHTRLCHFRCLFWNECGHISKQNTPENNNLHIYMFSGPLSGYIKKSDKYNCHIASLANYGLYTRELAGVTDNNDVALDGVVCGSNLNSNNSVIGVIYYINLATNETWERRFKDESVTCVVISDNFIGAVTDLNILYIFTRNNLLLSAFKLKGKIRSLVANKNMLAILTQTSHDGTDTTLSVRLLWVNGIKGLSKNNHLKIISIYDDLLILNDNIDLLYVGLTSDFILWYIDTRGSKPGADTLH